MKHEIDERGRITVADLGDESVKIFASDSYFSGIIHITQGSDTIALMDKDLDGIIEALHKARNMIKEGV